MKRQICRKRNCSRCEEIAAREAWSNRFLNEAKAIGTAIGLALIIFALSTV